MICGHAGTEGPTNGSAMQPLLPPEVQDAYIRLKAFEVESYQQRMQQLAALSGPGIRAQVPDHALDEERSHAVYPPEDLLAF